MQNFDAALKGILERQFRGGALSEWFGFRVAEWLKNDLPEVRGRRVDLLGRTTDGTLVHIEIQSQNDAEMPLRMAEYALGILRCHGALPRQILLYVGFEPLRMPSSLVSEDVRFRYRALDIRELDAEPLIESDRLDDNVIAILARLKAERSDVMRILERVAHAKSRRRNRALAELTILAGLRRLRGIIETETHDMPLVLDIMDHDLFGPVMRKGMEKGLAEGTAAAREIAVNLLEGRFGNVPPHVTAQVSRMSVEELKDLSLRAWAVSSIGELFPATIRPRKSPKK